MYNMYATTIILIDFRAAHAIMHVLYEFFFIYRYKLWKNLKFVFTVRIRFRHTPTGLNHFRHRKLFVPKNDIILHGVAVFFYIPFEVILYTYAKVSRNRFHYIFCSNKNTAMAYMLPMTDSVHKHTHTHIICNIILMDIQRESAETFERESRVRINSVFIRNYNYNIISAQFSISNRSYSVDLSHFRTRREILKKKKNYDEYLVIVCDIIH